MKRTVAVAALYLGHEVLASFAADTEDVVHLHVRDFIESTYKSAGRYDLDFTLDTFMRNHGMKLEVALVRSSRPIEDMKYVAVVDYPGTYQMFVGHSEDSISYQVDMFLTNYWSGYDNYRNAMKNFEALEEEHGEEAFTYQHITNF